MISLTDEEIAPILERINNAWGYERWSRADIDMLIDRLYQNLPSSKVLMAAHELIHLLFGALVGVHESSSPKKMEDKRWEVVCLMTTRKEVNE